MESMRTLLECVGVEDAQEYRTHDLRRGHTQDMVESGANLAEILLAGEWGPRGFKPYVHEGILEANAVLQAHFDASDEEEAPVG